MYAYVKKESIQKKSKTNNTGIPDQMKQHYENTSGYSFDDVRVHYNSDKPTQLSALAYTQGTNVFVGSGQEKHLEHELGHVIQQKQGRVRPTKIVNSIPVNDDQSLENEADMLSEKIQSVYQYATLKNDDVAQLLVDPGVGIELETSDIRITTPVVDDEAKKKETYWKGKKLKEFTSSKGIKWSVTIDTTTFSENADTVWEFSVEIIVDGTTLKLKEESNELKILGNEIKETLKDKSKIDLAAGLTIDSIQFSKKGANFTDDTNFFAQITCAMSLEQVYDMYTSESKLISSTKDIFKETQQENWKWVWKSSNIELSSSEFGEYVKLLQPEALSKLQYNGGDDRIVFISEKIEKPVDQKRKEMFIYMIDQIFGSGNNGHDPKQNIPAMPRTSLGEIFLKTFNKIERESLLSQIEKRVDDGKKGVDIGDKDKVTYQQYLDYLKKVNVDDKSDDDPITKHPEPLGIGKLGKKMEGNLSKTEELPLFEFRQIGSCKLGEFPDKLGELNDEMVKRLK